MQRENVQYVANSKNYWYRSESEKSGLWVKNTCGEKLLSFEPNSCSHNKFIVNFGVWRIWASRIYWRYLKISNISMTPPQMRVLFKLLQNAQFWLFWQDFKNSHRSAILDVSKSFILMMDTYSQIYIKSNFQDLTFWAGKFRKLLIFKAADFAYEIAKNAFWRSFCSWKTPISWLVTIKWPLQTPMLVVVLMMINPHFLMLKSAILKLCQLLHFESLHCFKFRFLSRFVLSPLGPNVYKQVWDRKQPILRLFASPTYLWKRPHLKQFQRLIAIFEAFSQINLIRDNFEKVQDLSFWIVLCSPR